MVQVSRRFIDDVVTTKLLDLFLSSILRIKDKKSAERFFEEFFTSTEKIMLTKRIACLYLLFKRISVRQISDTLKLSTSTVGKYQLFLSKNPTLTEIFRRILLKENITRALDTFINEYISSPMKYGTDWKLGHKLHREFQKRKALPL